MSDHITPLLRRVIWDRRHAYYSAAVSEGIITDEQACALLELHRERDEAQDRAEAEAAGQ